MVWEAGIKLALEVCFPAVVLHSLETIPSSCRPLAAPTPWTGTTLFLRSLVPLFCSLVGCAQVSGHCGQPAFVIEDPMTIYSLGLWLRRSSSCVILNLRNSSPLSLLPCVLVLVSRSIVVERVRSAQFPLGEKTLSASAGCHFQAVAGRGSTAEAVNARTRLTALEPRSLRAVERVGVPLSIIVFL